MTITTTQAHQFGILDAQDDKMCIPEAYTCNHWNRMAYCEGYIWVRPDNWTARTILGIDSDVDDDWQNEPGYVEARQFPR